MRVLRALQAAMHHHCACRRGNVWGACGRRAAACRRCAGGMQAGWTAACGVASPEPYEPEGIPYLKAPIAIVIFRQTTTRSKLEYD